VFLGTTVTGLKTTPSSGGLDPRCVTELKTATFEVPALDLVPIKLADLNPEQLFIKFILKT
jgi:hypothetical protein